VRGAYYPSDLSGKKETDVCHNRKSDREAQRGLKMAA